MTTSQIRKHPKERYIRLERFPHIWCAGCGNGIILNSFVTALNELEMNLKKLVVVSGIGCIGRIAGYVKCDSFHTTHGRAIALATGIKLADPQLTIAVISGDGDLFAIGGNHFIHAARRNIDMTVICSNNFNYGMTGGQFAPTTPLRSFTTTTPYGNIEHPFNLAHLAAASGAVYVARWTTMHIKELTDSIKKSLKKKGFKFIEVISPCPEIFGRRNKLGDAVDLMRTFKEISEVKPDHNPSEAEVSAKKIVVGEFLDIKKPTYGELLQEQHNKIQKKLTGG
ncbi:MAG: thiamine pyrophosphate-dependent enzyme [Candidatus Bathyarchaeota archaeon]|jgi:2-oxoglutarate ferredoxin oxidoreductase subunit beta